MLAKKGIFLLTAIVMMAVSQDISPAYAMEEKTQERVSVLVKSIRVSKGLEPSKFSQYEGRKVHGLVDMDLDPTLPLRQAINKWLMDNKNSVIDEVIDGIRIPGKEDIQSVEVDSISFYKHDPTHNNPMNFTSTPEILDTKTAQTLRIARMNLHDASVQAKDSSMTVTLK